MTDHRTLRLFADPSADTVVVRAPVSRLVVDVERFPDDADEPMAARGMGVVYTTTSQLTPLRRVLSDSERKALLQAYLLPSASCAAGGGRRGGRRPSRAMPDHRLPQFPERGAALRMR